LDSATWSRVKAIARSRLNQGPRGRSSRAAAARDLALILLMGDMGLRSEEARTLLVSSIAPKRSDGLTPWLRVHGKGDKHRDLPIPPEVAAVLLQWREHRDQIVADRTPLLFPRLGRRRHDGSYPDAGPSIDHGGNRLDDGRLSGRALRDIVAPIMQAAGVPGELAHPHVLRHTYGTQFMRKPNARLEQLRVLMGHASIETTAGYIHHTEADLEAAVLDHHGPTDVLTADAQRRHARNARRAA
jgi:site-specific recombinase XerD